MENHDLFNVKANTHPKEKANFFSKLFFCWTIPTFKKGYKVGLKESDLHENLKVNDSGVLGDKLEDKWLLERKSREKPSLRRAIWKVFCLEICLQGFIQLLLEFGTKLIHPLCLAKLLEFYVPNQKSMSKSEAYVYGILIIAASLTNVLLGHNCVLMNQHLGMKVRVACCSLIYRNTLKLSSATADTGHVVNLLSNDVNRFDSVFIFLHNIWTAPIQIVVVTSLLYIMLGIYALAGIGFFVIFIPLQMFLGRMMSRYRLKVALKTDNRIRLMNEIIYGIQVIKMYAWEKPFTKMIEKARSMELKKIKSTSIIKAFFASFSIFMTRTAIFLSIITYVLTGNTLTAYFVFTLTSFYNVLRQSIVVHIPQAISNIAEVSASIKRIESFLLKEEVPNISQRTDESNKTSNSQTGISMRDVSTKWNKNVDDVLSDINFEVHNKELVAIVGTVGSGKSSFLQAILKEVPIIKGNIQIVGRISYAPQQPWLFPATIRENILFGQKMDQKKYDEVCKVCALSADLSLLPLGDRTTVGDRGVLLSGGQKARINLARAVYNEADVYLLDDSFSSVDLSVGEQIYNDCILKYLANKCVVLVTNQLQYVRSANRICVIRNGSMEEYASCNELNIDDFKTVNNQEVSSETNVSRKNSVKVNKRIDEVKEVQKRSLEKSLFGKYIKAGGGYIMGVSILALFVIVQFSASLADYFVTYWVNMEQNKNFTNTTQDSNKGFFVETKTCIIFYFSLVLFIIITTLIRSIVFMDFCMIASKRLHNKMFHNVINTSMRFFHINTAGNILNRFSKDIGSVDETLPLVVLETFQVFLNVIFISVLVGIVNSWILILSLIILVIFYWLKLVYLASSRDIKRIESARRSPIFSQVNSSVQGLTTIRSFGAQENLKREFDNRQNEHNSAFYMFLICNRAFGVWLDLHCVVYVGLVIISFLFLLDETYGGNVGLAITQSLALTGMFQWGMRQWSELDNQMISVERVTEYASLKSEEDNISERVPDYWPEHGDIKFENVSLRYAPEEPLVLNNVNFIIKPSEKVGIVGRTGAGKTSLLAALFRLADVQGRILIDGIDIKTVFLQNLRSKISIIPQEPVLFSGTLRKNLDPSDKYENEQLWRALREVELEFTMKDLPSGLNSKVSDAGSNFSVGQRQLICIARAIVENNNILIFDEATANVDPETDALIQRSMREKFRKCTVLTIAHRLHTVMDSDKILVMDGGNVVEFGQPRELLQNKNGVFYQLVHSTTDSIAQELSKIAGVSYNNTRKNV